MIDPKDICIEDYDYALSDEKIAKFPLAQRDQSKLLIYKNGNISESIYANIAAHLPKNSFLIFNNTKVVKARLLFRKETGALIEIFCLEPLDFNGEPTQAMAKKQSAEWTCLVGNAKKWKEGKVAIKSDSGFEIYAEKITKHNDAFHIKFSWNNDYTFSEVLTYLGELPLPPYMNRKAEKKDEETYQTVYAKHEGSVAAPTAGLHFTENVLQSLKNKNHDYDFVTLHVGAGTFKPVDSEKIGNHDMHFEVIDVSLDFLKNLLEKIQQSHPIIPVGTTSLRTLESLYWLGVKAMKKESFSHLLQWECYDLEKETISPENALTFLIKALEKNKQSKLFAKTQLMIAPSYQFKIANGIITNFHQPKSTLLVLVSALIGNDWKTVYNYALENNFRFLSYGDGCLLIKSYE
ncbi:MAG: S-adenosylmethionine:tRNA ribosyltransferase-isomerase [Bacteroidia bacterium]